MAQIRIFEHDRDVAIPYAVVRFSKGRESSEAAFYDALSKVDGSQTWPVPLWPVQEYTLHINKGDYKNPAFEEAEHLVTVDKYGEDIDIKLKRVKAVVDLGSVVVSGPLLRLPDGTPWRWKMVTGFDAPRRFMLGELDALRAYFGWLRSVNGNGIRAFGGWSRTGFDFRLIANYFGKLEDYCKFHGDEGVRCEFVPICDAIPPSENEQRDYLNRCADVLVKYGWMFEEYANEPWKNGCDTMRFDVRRPGLLTSHGAPMADSFPYPYAPSVGYSTHHSPRSEDWARKCGKDSYEIRHQATHDVVIDNEPPGFAEVANGSSRVNNPQHAFSAGVGAGMFCPGMTAHGDSNTMQLCNVPGPIETDCTRQVFRGIDLVPLDAPTWTYARYGPSNPGIPMPVEEDLGPNKLTDHMHAMIGGNRAVVCNYYPSPNWIAKGANGWRVVTQDYSFVLCER